VPAAAAEVLRVRMAAWKGRAADSSCARRVRSLQRRCSGQQPCSDTQQQTQTQQQMLGAR
jgi:hypothetical protein